MSAQSSFHTVSRASLTTMLKLALNDFHWTSALNSLLTCKESQNEVQVAVKQSQGIWGQIFLDRTWHCHLFSKFAFSKLNVWLSSESCNCSQSWHLIRWSMRIIQTPRKDWQHIFAHLTTKRQTIPDCSKVLHELYFSKIISSKDFW